MFTSFIDIINGFKLWKRLTSKQSHKDSKSLPKQLEAKVMTIQQAKDLTKLPFEELIESLMTYEINMKVIKKLKTRRKIEMTFKASTINDEEEESEGENLIS